MKRSLLMMMCLLWVALPTLAQASLAERGFGVYAPSYLTPESDPVPLVIGLHGFGDTVQNFAPATGLLQLAEEEGFVVAFPNAYLRQWNDGSRGDHYEDDVAIIMELITMIADEVSIDPERIYLVGFSNGATMVYRAHCEQPDLFAGIAAVGGSMRMGQECPARAYQNVFIMHSLDDTIVPFMGSEANRRHSAPQTARIWSQRNECQDDVAPFDPEFEGRSSSLNYADCAEGHQVTLYAVRNIPHTWPGAFARYHGQPIDEEIDAASLIWDFFESAYETETVYIAPEVTEEAP